ncbi:hypothetical protein KCU92_g1559, partial [Aureobasidium melanogenum]
MEFRESKAAKHADYVFDSLLKAEALYDEGAYGDCVALLYNLIENYNMGPLPRLKTLVMLCVLHGDWEYAEACRLEAEDIWHHCDKHSEEGYDKAALAKFRASLDNLEKDMRANPFKPVSEMTDEEVDYRLRLIGDVPVKAPPGPQSHMTFEEIEEMHRIAQRGALEDYYTKHRAPPSAQGEAVHIPTKPPTNGEPSDIQAPESSTSGKHTKHAQHSRNASAPSRLTHQKSSTSERKKVMPVRLRPDASNIVDRISALDPSNPKDSLEKAYKMVKKCYHDQNYLECLAGAKKLLITYQISPKRRLKIFIYMASSAREATEREEYRKLVEGLYQVLVNELPAGEDPNTRGLFKSILRIGKKTEDSSDSGSPANSNTELSPSPKGVRFESAPSSSPQPVTVPKTRSGAPSFAKPTMASQRRTEENIEALRRSAKSLTMHDEESQVSLAPSVKSSRPTASKSTTKIPRSPSGNTIHHTEDLKRRNSKGGHKRAISTSSRKSGRGVETYQDAGTLRRADSVKTVRRRSKPEDAKGKRVGWS